MSTPPPAPPQNDWYYYDNDTAEKFGPVSKEQLQSFARNGTITPDTVVEAGNGRQGKARLLPWLDFPTPTPPPRANRYYINGRGPFSEEQLKTFAANGTITPDTPIENEDGVLTEAWALAEEIPGLVFPRLAPQSKFRVRDFFEWLFDFGFENIVVLRVFRVLVQLQFILFLGLCIIKLVYSLCMVGHPSHTEFGWVVFDGTLASLLGVTSTLGQFFVFLFEIILTIIDLILFRLFCEFQIFFLDWLVKTKKAAERFINAHTQE